MSTQHLMKGFTVKAEKVVHVEGARIEWMHSSLDKTRHRANPGPYFTRV